MRWGVVPAFCCERTIRGVVDGFLPHLHGIVVVDDGSTDATASVVKTTRAHLIRHEENRGYSAAIRTGIRFALDSGATTVVTFDADGAHVPDDLPPLLRCFENRRTGLLIGSRFIENTGDIPSQKRDANEFAASLVNELLGTRFSDVASGFRCIDRNFAEAISQTAMTGFSLPYEMLHAAVQKTVPIAEYPISVRYDASLPHQTAHNELLDFVGTVSAWQSINEQYTVMALHKALVMRQGPVSVKIGNRVFWLHPSAADEAWAIQRQRHPLPLRQADLEIRRPVDLEVGGQEQPNSDTVGLRIGLIPDGTRRWSRANGVSLEIGYGLAMTRLEQLTDWLLSNGARAVSLFLCSRANLTFRSPSEIEAFARPEGDFIAEQIPRIARKHRASVRIAGNRDILPPPLAEAARLAEQASTSDPEERRLYLCLGYDPRDELSRGLDDLWVDDELDVVVRTGGSNVLSGFLPLQSANARLYFLDLLFNDIQTKDLLYCIRHYQRQHLRRGE